MRIILKLFPSNRWYWVLRRAFGTASFLIWIILTLHICTPKFILLSLSFGILLLWRRSACGWCKIVYIVNIFISLLYVTFFFIAWLISLMFNHVLFSILFEHFTCILLLIMLFNISLFDVDFWFTFFIALFLRYWERFDRPQFQEHDWEKILSKFGFWDI